MMAIFAHLMGRETSLISFHPSRAQPARGILQAFGPEQLSQPTSPITEVPTFATTFQAGSAQVTESVNLRVSG